MSNNNNQIIQTADAVPAVIGTQPSNDSQSATSGSVVALSDVADFGEALTQLPAVARFMCDVNSTFKWVSPVDVVGHLSNVRTYNSPFVSVYTRNGKSTYNENALRALYGACAVEVKGKVLEITRPRSSFDDFVASRSVVLNAPVQGDRMLKAAPTALPFSFALTYGLASQSTTVTTSSAGLYRNGLDVISKLVIPTVSVKPPLPIETRRSFEQLLQTGQADLRATYLIDTQAGEAMGIPAPVLMALTCGKANWLEVAKFTFVDVRNTTVGGAVIPEEGIDTPGFREAWHRYFHDIVDDVDYSIAMLFTPNSWVAAGFDASTLNMFELRPLAYNFVDHYLSISSRPLRTGTPAPYRAWLDAFYFRSLLVTKLSIINSMSTVGAYSGCSIGTVPSAKMAALMLTGNAAQPGVYNIVPPPPEYLPLYGGTVDIEPYDTKLVLYNDLASMRNYKASSFGWVQSFYTDGTPTIVDTNNQDIPHLASPNVWLLMPTYYWFYHSGDAWRCTRRSSVSFRSLDMVDVTGLVSEPALLRAMPKPPSNF